MKFPTTCEEFLTTLKAKSKVEGRQPEKSKSESLDPFNYEEVLKVLGRFGTWQCLLFAQLAFVCLLDGLFENLYAFTAFTPKYRCSIPFCEHPQNASYFGGEKAQEIGNFPIYVKRGISADLLETGESCEYLGISGMPMGMDQEAILNKESCDFYLSETGRNSSDLQQMKCGDENLVFDKSLTSTSIVTSFHLTCSHRKWIKSFVDVLHHVAFLFGLVVFGLVADRFGRQKAILGGLCFTSVAGIFAAFADGVGGFAFFHFCVGLGKAGLFLPAFTLMLELSGKTLAMCLFPAKIVGGGLCASLLSYLIPVWSSLQLVAFGLGLAFFIPVTFFAHESPRWLLSKGKCDTARNVVKQAALMNGREIKVQILHPTNSNKQQQTEQEENKTSNFNLWRDVIFNLEDKTASFYRWWMVNLCFQWTFLGLCLKGQLVQAAPPGNPYANVSYEALTSIPGLLVALFLSGKTWGSRPLLTFCHLLSGGMFLVQSFGLYFILPSLALFGHLTANMFLYGSLASLQLLTSLMAPATQHRATFSGICWAFFATGAVASHLLNLLVITAQWLPTTILALFSIMAAFLVYFFPETTGLASIPEKWEDIKVLKTLPKKSYLQFNLPQLNVLKSILNLH